MPRGQQDSSHAAGQPSASGSAHADRLLDSCPQQPPQTDELRDNSLPFITRLLLSSFESGDPDNSRVQHPRHLTRHDWWTASQVLLSLASAPTCEGTTAPHFSAATTYTPLLQLMAYITRLPFHRTLKPFMDRATGDETVPIEVTCLDNACAAVFTLCSSSDIAVSTKADVATKLLRMQTLQACAQQLAAATELLKRVGATTTNNTRTATYATADANADNAINTDVAAPAAGSAASGPSRGPPAPARNPSSLLYVWQAAYHILNRSLTLLCAIDSSTQASCTDPRVYKDLGAGLVAALRESRMMEHAARLLMEVQLQQQAAAGASGAARSLVTGISLRLLTAFYILVTRPYEDSTKADYIAAGLLGIDLSNVLGGRCLQHVVLLHGVATLHAADGGSTYGIPPEVLDCVPVHFQEVEAVTGLDPCPVLSVLRVTNLNMCLPPPNEVAVMRLQLRVVRLLLASVPEGSAITTAATTAPGGRGAGIGAVANGSPAEGGPEVVTAGANGAPFTERTGAVTAASQCTDTKHIGGPQPQWRLAITPSRAANFTMQSLLMVWGAHGTEARWAAPGGADEWWRLVMAAAGQELCTCRPYTLLFMVLNSALGRAGLRNLGLRTLPPDPPPDFRAALSAGLLPFLERIIRKAAAATEPGAAGPGSSSGSASSSTATSSSPAITVSTAAINSGPPTRPRSSSHPAAALHEFSKKPEVLPVLLAYGEPRQGAHLVASLGKALRRMGPEDIGRGPLWDAATLAAELLKALGVMAAVREDAPGPQQSDPGQQGGPSAQGVPQPGLSALARRMVPQLLYAALTFLPEMSRLLRQTIATGDDDGLLVLLRGWGRAIGTCLSALVQCQHVAAARVGGGHESGGGCGSSSGGGSWQSFLLEEVILEQLKCGTAAAAIGRLEDTQPQMFKYAEQDITAFNAGVAEAYWTLSPPCTGGEDSSRVATSTNGAAAVVVENVGSPSPGQELLDFTQPPPAAVAPGPAAVAAGGHPMRRPPSPFQRMLQEVGLLQAAPWETWAPADSAVGYCSPAAILRLMAPACANPRCVNLAGDSEAALPRLGGGGGEGGGANSGGGGGGGGSVVYCSAECQAAHPLGGAGGGVQGPRCSAGRP